MAGGAIYTADEDRAVHELYKRHRSNWERHIDDYPQLARRTMHSVRQRIYGVLNCPAIYQAIPVTRPGWPLPGVILFHDDPRAIADHGSPGRISAPHMHSYGCVSYGAVAEWVE